MDTLTLWESICSKHIVYERYTCRLVLVNSVAFLYGFLPPTFRFSFVLFHGTCVQFTYSLHTFGVHYAISLISHSSTVNIMPCENEGKIIYFVTLLLLLLLLPDNFFLFFHTILLWVKMRKIRTSSVHV